MRMDNALRGVQKLGVDSSVFIYFVEHDTRFVPQLRIIFNRIQNGQIEGITSVVALTEILVVSLRDVNEGRVQSYRTLLLETENLRLLPVDVDIAEEAARLRAVYQLKTPDALMIATALHAGCEAFLTNDDALRPVSGELRVLILKELIS